MWMTSCTRSACAGDFQRFWKSRLVELSPATGKDGWFSLARGGLGQVSHEMEGGRWKSQSRKNVYLSPYIEEPFNSKVIKSFVPELWSRKYFSYFRIPILYAYIYIYIYIWIFDAHFTHRRIMGMVQINRSKCGDYQLGIISQPWYLTKGLRVTQWLMCYTVT